MKLTFVSNELRLIVGGTYRTKAHANPMANDQEIKIIRIEDDMVVYKYPDYNQGQDVFKRPIDEVVVRVDPI